MPNNLGLFYLACEMGLCRPLFQDRRKDGSQSRTFTTTQDEERARRLPFQVAAATISPCTLRTPPRSAGVPRRDDSSKRHPMQIQSTTRAMEKPRRWAELELEGDRPRAHIQATSQRYRLHAQTFVPDVRGNFQSSVRRRNCQVE